MTSVCRWMRTFSITGAMVLAATAASPQSAHHEGVASSHEGIQSRSGPTPSSQPSMAATLKIGMTRMAAADAELDALVADMNMFMGEMKIDIMARLLTLLVERQAMMRQHMMAMHDRLMRTMSEGVASPTVERPADTTTDDPEPGLMCVPTL